MSKHDARDEKAVSLKTATGNFGVTEVKEGSRARLGPGLDLAR